MATAPSILHSPTLTSESEPGLLDRMAAAFKLRLPVLMSLLVCLSLFVLIRGNPFQVYWTFVFEGLRLYLWWPLLFLLCFFLFPLAGYFKHRRSGLALFLPVASLLAALGFALLFFVLLTEWAVDWPLLWCAAVIVILAVSALVIVLGLICYVESWRITCNRQVIARVRQALDTEEFENYLNGGWRWNPQRWGSEHCLQIVEGHYQQKKRDLLLIMGKNARQIEKPLDDCLRAGSTLLAYLQLRIATMPREDQDWRVAELAREMATIYLWVAATSPQHPRVDYRKIDEWMHLLRQALKEGYLAYTNFLEHVFRLAENPPQSEEEINKAVIVVMNRFEQVAAIASTTTRELLDICSSTWLAVSPTCQPRKTPPELWRQVAIDVWIHMRRRQGAKLLVSSDNSKETDVAKVWASNQLIVLYEAWRARTPEAWNQDLERRVREARQAVVENSRAPLPNPWPMIEDKTKGTSSWPYLFVWKTPRVLQQALILAGCFLLFNIVVLTAVNPRMPLNFGWNTVDRITDRRAFHNYTSEDIRAMAGSKNLLALATSEGVTLINKKSRVPINVITDDPARDVTRGPGPDSFIALGENGQIAQLTSSFWNSQQIWLPKSDVPFWPGTGQPGPIIANHLDQSGWLVCMKEKGIARYRFGDLNGRLYRTRSWQLGDLYDVPLLDARITQSGVWGILSGGGIRYAALDSLREDQKRRLDSEEIHHFDADYRGSHAVAIGASKSLWLYPPEDKGWVGPFFGQDPLRLKAAADITVGRLVGDTAWLGTGYGLFAYDANRRLIRSVINEGSINQILVGESTPTVLTAGNKGLYLVGEKDNSYTAQQLDSGQVSSLSLSPDGRLCLYRLLTGDSGGQFEVRRILSPFDKGPELLVSAKGWKAMNMAPTILGIKSLDSGALFITAEGSFWYDPAKHLYEDCSKSVFIREQDGQRTEQEDTLRSFSQVDPGQQQILSIADSNPQLFVVNEKRWKSLDPQRVTQPRQIIGFAGDILAVGVKGELYLYNAASLSPVSFLTGESASLRQQPLVNNRVAGDLLPLDGASQRWKLAMLRGNSIITYESETGRMEEKQVPFAGTVQVRWGQANLLYLRSNGAVATAERPDLFGNGVLPFAPNQATAFTRGDSDSSIIVSGPGRILFKYQWGNASWTRVAPSPIPGRSEVAQIAQTQSGVLSQLSDGSLFFTTGKTWIALPGYQRWAATGAEYSFWGLKPDGLARIKPREDKGVNEWEEARFATGQGMRKFVESSTYVWKMDDANLVFFTAGSQIGVYNSSLDAWKESQLGELKNPSQFVVAGGCMIILDSNRLLRVNSELKVQQISQIPPEAKSINLRVNGESLLLAFLTEKGKVTLRVWTKGCEGAPAEYTRGSDGPVVYFDPTQVVYAKEESPSSVLLLDTRGNCFSYNWVRGTWQTQRKAKEGQELYGWLPTKGSSPTVIVLTTSQGTKVQTTSSSTFETAISEAPRSLERPADGELLDEDEVNIIRENGQTHFKVYRGEEWQALHPHPRGFVEDSAQDLAISSSGQLWALQGDWLTLTAPGKDRALTLTSQVLALSRPVSTINEILKEPQVAALGFPESNVAETLATLDYLNLHLSWAKQPNGSITPFWEGADSGLPELPVYCGDRLASQCIQDIAMSPDNLLLLSTEIGLLVRNPGTFDLMAVYPHLRGTRFVRTDGGTRLLLRVNQQIVFEWKEGNLVPMLQDAASLVERFESGPWVWQRFASGLVTIVSKATGRLRSWSRVDGGWKFDDDIVKWILRGDHLVLQTNNGLWAFDENGSRQEPELSNSDRPGDEFSIATPAIRINYSAGMISLHPFDGNDRPAFEQGRFFFDNNKQLCGSGTYLYTLVPNRGLFRRSPQTPGIISDVWAVTPEAALGSEYILESVAEVVRVKSNAPGAEGKFAFQLDTEQQGNPWRRVEIGSERSEINLGAVKWQFEEGRSRLFEALLTVGSQEKLYDWWSEDRFVWDKINGVEAVDENTAIFITAAGPMVVRFTTNGYEPVCFWLMKNVLHCAVAREQGQRVGVVVWGETEFPQYLFTNEGGQCSLTTRNGGDSLLWEPRLRVQFEESDDYGRYIAIGTRWERRGSQDALVSGLGNLLSTEELITDGQFIYDCASAASPAVNGTVATNDWLVASACSSSGTSANHIALFTYYQENNNQPSRLLLRGFWPAPCSFESLRLSQSGEVIGVGRITPQAWQAFKVDLQSGQPVWTKMELGETGNSFRSGDKVRIDLKTLNWSRQGSAYPWTEKALETTPAAYDLFSTTPKGAMMSFDRMNTLSFDATGKTIAVGTDGGVFLWPYDKGGLNLLALGQGEGVFTFNQSAKPDRWILRVEQLRRDGEGRLWAKYGSKASIAEMTKQGNWIPNDKNDWATLVGRFQGYSINLDGVGFGVGSKKYRESNDAWSIGNRQLANIVDFSFDAETRNIWIATRNYGVCKVVTKHLK